MEYKRLQESFDAEDGIGDSARIFSRRDGGVGESFSDGIIICTRRKLYEESVALAAYLRRFLSINGRVLLIGGGMYDTAVITTACSLVGCALVLSEAVPVHNVLYDVIIASQLPEESCVRYKSYLSFGELNAVILGEMIEKSDNVNEVGESDFSVSFISGDGEIESYPEQMAVRVACRYADAQGIFPWDVCMSTLHPCTKEGFFAGFLAPMLRAKKWIYCDDPQNVFEEMRLCSPTKLTTTPEIAERLLGEMEALRSAPSVWQKGRGSNPLRLKLDRIFPRTSAAIRRFRMIYVHYHFGGMLSGVTTLGELSESCMESLAHFGVLSSSLIGTKNCALSGYRKYGDSNGYWRLPDGLFADMCDVRAGGVGKVTFYGDGISIGPTNGHTFKAGELRNEYNENAILVSEFCGFSTSKRIFFAQKTKKS